MKTNIFIPKTIKVGFQNRSDTYTQKLAYVIYYDQKNVLRKEKSWEGWRDKNIEPQEFVNEPTSGFVLNKKVGDYQSNWNHRHAYCRVYDPRNFEIEISIENLLYILENNNSIKGKGLEGQFVYAYSGKDLLLLPVDSPDYKEITQYNKILHEKNYVKVKDLVLGGTYKTKSDEEYIYMGRFDYYDDIYESVPYEANSYYGKTTRYKSVKKNVNKGKYHYFVKETKSDYNDSIYFNILTLKSLGERFISIISTECVENYADLFDKLECNPHYSPIDESKDEYIRYTFEEYNEKLNSNRNFYCYDSQKNNLYIQKINSKSNYCYYENRNYDSNYKRTEGIIEEIYNQLQPMYKNTYLANGKIYEGGK